MALEARGHGTCTSVTTLLVSHPNAATSRKDRSLHLFLDCTKSQLKCGSLHMLSRVELTRACVLNFGPLDLLMPYQSFIRRQVTIVPERMERTNSVLEPLLRAHCLNICGENW